VSAEKDSENGSENRPDTGRSEKEGSAEAGPKDEIVAAETQEWSPEDVAEHEGEEEPGEEEPGEEEPGEEEPDGEETDEEPAEEPTVVAAPEPERGAGLRRVGAVLLAPFRGLRRFRMPIWARFVTGSFLIVASVAGATAASALLGIDDFAQALRHGNTLSGVKEQLSDVDGGEPQTIMVIGSDLEPVGKLKKFKGLSDTTMLIRLDPDREAIALFSLPRDLRVEIPGYGIAKLNEAYTIGGPKLTLRTVRNLTRSAERPEGLPIHHLVNVDFTGFARAVNEIDCVYVDVDRRYFNVNSPYDAEEDYDEINVQPGYQALCGMDALDYVRYRHTDNDVVRAARQQDFLREARQKVPPTRLFRELVGGGPLTDIFTEHTTSDIDNTPAMLEVIKLFIEARNAPVKEIHFEGHLGPSFVTATRGQINRAVDQFLGIEDTPGARALTAKPEDPQRRAEAQEQGEGRAAAKARRKRDPSDLGLVATSYGRQLAQGIRRRVKERLPTFYPTLLEVGTDYAQKPRVYKINGTGEDAPPRGQRLAYKWVFSRPLIGEYYGFMGTLWRDPPILKNPTATREFGDREYDLFYDGDRLRTVAWESEEGSFWVSNTLIQSLSEREMVEIARAMRELPVPGRK